MEELIYKIVLEPEDDGGFSVYVPSLPGCFSQGATHEEAVCNIKEAIAGYIRMCRKYCDAVSTGVALQ